MIVEAEVDRASATATLTFEGEIDVESYDVLRDAIVAQRDDGVSSIVSGAMPFSRAAAAVTSLNVEPGG